MQCKLYLQYVFSPEKQLNCCWKRKAHHHTCESFHQLVIKLIYCCDGKETAAKWKRIYKKTSQIITLMYRI